MADSLHIPSFVKMMVFFKSGFECLAYVRLRRAENFTAHNKMRFCAEGAIDMPQFAGDIPGAISRGK